MLLPVDEECISDCRRLRVLHIGKFFPPAIGGIENFLGDLLPALERTGVATAALVHDDPYAERGAIWTDPVGVYRVPCYGTLLYAPISPGFPLAVRKTISDFNPDILHFHVPNTSAFWALSLQNAVNLPWVIHWHADVVPSAIDRRMALAYRLYRPVERLFLRRAQSIIATSHAYLKTSSSLADFREKCHVIPLGLDRLRLRPAHAMENDLAEKLWRQSEARILVIGRLTYYKGHDVMLEAAAALPGARILIVGKGERESVLQKRIQLLGLADRVLMPGFMPETDLHALIASCDCLCLPSIERTEAFGLVILEAMRYGKPVVASDIPGSGIGWVVENGITGFLVPPGDPVSLAGAVCALFEQPGLKSKMGQAAIGRFMRFFQIDRIAQEVAFLYRYMLVCRRLCKG